MQKFGQRILMAFRRFMTGRYGTDKLNSLLLGLGLATCFINLFVWNDIARLILTAVSYGFMILALYRCFSRNTYKRYRENRKYMLFRERIRDRKNRYFSCPRCHQPVRVPRGKGKISISCPKCGNKFVKKT